MSLLVKLDIFFALMIDLDFLFQSFLSVLSNLPILLLESLAFLIDLGELLLDLNHQLLISDGHHIPEEDELIVVIEDVHDILNGFLFQDFCFDFASKFVEVSLEDFMGSFSKFYLLLPILIGDKLSEKFLQPIFSICS